MNEADSKSAQTMENWRESLAVMTNIICVPAVMGILLLVWILFSSGDLSPGRAQNGILLWIVYSLGGFCFQRIYCTIEIQPGTRRKAGWWFASAAYNFGLMSAYLCYLCYVHRDSSGFKFVPPGLVLFVIALISYVGGVTILSVAQGVFQLRLLRLQKENLERAELAREVGENGTSA